MTHKELEAAVSGLQATVEDLKTEISRLWTFATVAHPKEEDSWMPRWLRLTLRVMTGFGLAVTPLLAVILARGGHA